jgi:hypothetical protein
VSCLRDLMHVFSFGGQAALPARSASAKKVAKQIDLHINVL